MWHVMLSWAPGCWSRCSAGWWRSPWAVWSLCGCLLFYFLIINFILLLPANSGSLLFNCVTTTFYSYILLWFFCSLIFLPWLLFFDYLHMVHFGELGQFSNVQYSHNLDKCWQTGTNMCFYWQILTNICIYCHICLTISALLQSPPPQVRLTPVWAS